MTRQGHGLKLRFSIQDEMAAWVAPLGEKLSQWRLTARLLEYLYIKLSKRQILYQMNIIKNAPSYKHGDAAHLTFLELELAEIRRVEAGERSVSEYNRLCEIHGTWRGLASSRIMIRMMEIRRQMR